LHLPYSKLTWCIEHAGISLSKKKDFGVSYRPSTVCYQSGATRPSISNKVTFSEVSWSSGAFKLGSQVHTGSWGCATFLVATEIDLPAQLTIEEMG